MVMLAERVDRNKEKYEENWKEKWIENEGEYNRRESLKETEWKTHIDEKRERQDCSKNK
jgi:hypothetical protein